MIKRPLALCKAISEIKANLVDYSGIKKNKKIDTVWGGTDASKLLERLTPEGIVYLQNQNNNKRLKTQRQYCH